MYDTGVPPEVGATTVTVADVLPATADGWPGVPGARTGVTEADATEESEVPVTFVAVDVNVYGVPFVNPFTVHEPDAPVTVH